MYGKPSDKSADRRTEVLTYLVKAGYAQDTVQAPPGGTGVSALDVGVNGLYGLDAYNAGRGAHGAYDAFKGGQGASAAGKAFAKPFGLAAPSTLPPVQGSSMGFRAVGSATPTAPVSAAQTAGRWGTAGKVLGKAGVGAGVGLSAYGTYNSVKNQTQNAQAYKGTGRSYMGSEEGMWDTLSTLGDAAPMVGAGVGAALGGGVGALPGVAIGTAVQGGIEGAKWMGKGLTGYDPDKMRAARGAVKGEGFNNSADFLQEGLAQDGGSDNDFTSTSWFGKKRNFKTEQLDNYLQQERTSKARSLTNPGQVA